MDKNRIRVMGVGFDPLTPGQASDELAAALSGGAGRPVYAVTPNPVMLMEARNNRPFREILNSADFVLCDGSGVLGAAERQGTPLPGRVTGIDTGMTLLKTSALTGRRVFLFGGMPGRATAAAEELCREIPGLSIAGTSDGYGDAENTEVLVRKITESGTDLLIVCLGTPKQEKWIADNIGRLNGVKVIMALGGAVDVWSGSVRRAPSVFIALRAEWLWRMIVSPSKVKLLPKLIKFRLLTRKGGKSACNQ